MTNPRAEIGARELIRDFLLATEGLSREAAARLAGVSITAIKRWAVSPPGQMRGELRARLLDYLRRRNGV